MRRRRGALTGLLLTAGLAAVPPPATGTAADQGPPQGTVAPAGLAVTVAGEGVETWPAYDATLGRFAIDTSEATDGRVEVIVSAEDPTAQVAVNGAEALLGNPHVVAGLRPGDEVNVQVSGAGGSSNQSWIYLPEDFPRLSAIGTDPGNGPVFLGLSSFLSETGFETVVDASGVPLHVREAEEPHDFRAHENGPAYTVFEPVKENDADTEYGYQVREYDRRFRLAGRERLRPVAELGVTADDTDFHDLQYLPDGRMLLMGYHRDFRADGTPWLDATLQIVDRRGHSVFSWSSKGHVEPEEGYVYGAKGQDYIHINSVEMQPGGDLVASFRNTGQILRIATVSHDGFEPGDVVWRLGGERNEFTFVGDPYGGICAQHDARILPNGHLLVFDNGSRRDDTGPIAPQTADMCPDPAEPQGTRVARPQSRIVEYALDTKAMTATHVWSFVPEGRYAAFAGNAQRLADGSTLASWSRSETADGSVAPFASRVSAAGEEVWALRAEGWFSYRAFSFPAPDRIPPRIALELPRPGGRYPEGTDVTPRFTCHDRGGSNLTGCRVAEVEGGRPGAPGDHRITLVADDAAGNAVTRRVRYTVAPLRQPDLQVRADGRGWQGAGRWPQQGVVHAGDRFAAPGLTVDYAARVVNAGIESERYVLTGRPGGRDWSVRYLHRGRDITRQLVAGRLTPRLEQGESWEFRIVVRRTARVLDGGERLTWVRARSRTDTQGRDRISVVSRAR